MFGGVNLLKISAHLTRLMLLRDALLARQLLDGFLLVASDHLHRSFSVQLLSEEVENLLV